MARTLHHAQETHPRPYGFANLVRHDPRNLVQVRQIVRRPRGQQLRQCDRAKRDVYKRQVYGERRSLTRDVGGTAGTTQFTEAVLAAMG